MARTKVGAVKKKKVLRPRNVSFTTFIYKVLKQVHPDTGISNFAMNIMNAFVSDMLTRVVTEAISLLEMGGRNTVDSREIQTAVRLILPGELAKHAVSEGTKAVTKSHCEDRDEIDDSDPDTGARVGEGEGEGGGGGSLFGGAGKGIKKKKSKSRVSKSFKAGLQFPVGRINSVIKDLVGTKRVSGMAAVYLAAVLEYLTAEILELAGNASRDNNRIRITPRHIYLAIANDEELFQMNGNIVIPGGGVLPLIHANLLPHYKDKTVNDNWPPSQEF